jgi:uncharacterized protein YkwD
MKKQRSLFTGILLLTVFLLLPACSATSVRVMQAGEGMERPITLVANGTTSSTSMSMSTMILPPEEPALLTPTIEPPLPTLTPTQAPAPTPVDTTDYPDSSAAAEAVLILINQERASMNRPALQMSEALIDSAHLHNIVMLQAHALSHQLPGEADPGARFSAQGVIWNMEAENIGYDYGAASQIAVLLNEVMFAERPPDDGHRLNILSSANVVGIDVIVNTQDSQVWLTEDFAQTDGQGTGL